MPPDIRTIHIPPRSAELETRRARLLSNDLRPMRRLFRKIFRMQADETGEKVQIPAKEEPEVIVTPEAQHEMIRAAYSTSH